MGFTLRWLGFLAVRLGLTAYLGSYWRFFLWWLWIWWLFGGGIGFDGVFGNVDRVSRLFSHRKGDESSQKRDEIFAEKHQSRVFSLRITLSVVFAKGIPRWIFCLRQFLEGFPLKIVSRGFICWR